MLRPMETKDSFMRFVVIGSIIAVERAGVHRSNERLKARSRDIELSVPAQTLILGVARIRAAGAITGGVL